MKTRVVPVDPRAPEAAVLALAAEVLRSGGLVAFPTETVYGLGGLARREASLARIFEAKGRPTHHPLIAHVTDAASAAALAAVWPEAAARLAASFWPGPLTLVVERAASVPASLAGGSATVAVRAPRHPVALGLIAAVGDAIAAPSANRYQSLSPTRAEHVLASLDGRVDLILDGGPCEEGIESTVVDVTGPVPTVLRPGALPLADLRRVVPAIEARALVAAETERRASPGMDGRHYSPRAVLVIVPTRAAALAEAARTGAALLLCGAADGAEKSAARVVVTLPADPALYARDLFSTLHAFDRAAVERIVVEAVPDDDAWWGVRDRLQRAAAPR